MQDSLRLYRWLLRFYPAGFREEYSVPMERQFRDDYSETRSSTERAELWARVIGDLLASVPRQIFHELIFDLKHAFRLYRKSWATTLLALIALSLAIGVSTGMFSVLNALLLRSLPFSNPKQLTELWFPPVTPMNGHTAFQEWAGKSQYLQDAASFSSSDMNLVQQHEALRVKIAETSSNFFSLLGMKPVLGRTFSLDEDLAGKSAVAVISFGLWQQLFGGSSNVLGSTLHLDGAPFTVIGVAPARFDYPGKTLIWTPTAFDFEKTPKRGAFFFHTIGRLKDGVSIGSARGLFEAELRRADPSGFNRTMIRDEPNRPRLVSIQDQLAGSVKQASWVLACLTLLVLLTACTNVAQLLLSRATERREELDLRAALGASRARLLQQMTTEALALTVLAAALGLAVAHWTAQITSSVSPAQLATQTYTVLDWRVLAFAIGLAIILGMVFGVLPVRCMTLSKPKNHYLGMKRMRAVLVALQAAFALCLVMGSLAMGSTFLRLLNADLGFRTSNVATLNVSVQGTRHQGAGEWQYYSEALDRLRAIPGVTAAGAVGYLPLADNTYMANSFKLDSGQQVPQVVINATMPGYFRAMGIRLISGIDFTWNLGRFVIVNEAFAQIAGLGPRIVGRSVISPWNRQLYRIIGVAGTTRFGGPAYAGAPVIYWRIQEEPPPALTFVASVSGNPETFIARCRDAVRSVDPEVPIYDVGTLDQRLADILSRPRFYTTATIFLGILAVLLATLGSYGAAAFSIAQRTREIGIRMAMGASYGKLRGTTLWQGLLPIACGVAGGIVLSSFLSRLLDHMVENAAHAAVWACTCSVCFMMFAGVVAVWSATNRILDIDPACALRAE